MLAFFEGGGGFLCSFEKDFHQLTFISTENWLHLVYAFFQRCWQKAGLF